MRTLSISYFIFFALIGIFVPYFNLYCRSIGFSAVQIGILFSAYGSMKCISPFLWGGWADRLMRRRELLILAGWASIVVFLGLFFTKQFWMMCVLMVFFGFFRTPTIPMVEATTWEHIPLRGWEYGKIRLWGSVGFIAATMLTGILSERYSIHIILDLMLALLILQGLFFLRMPGQLSGVKGKSERLRTLIRRPGVFLFLVVGFLIQVSHGMYYSFFSLHLDDLNIDRSVIGLCWTVSIACEVMLMHNYKNWFGRYRPMSILTLCAALGAVRWFVLSQSTQLPVIIGIQSLHAMTFGACHIASLTFLDRRVPSELKTRGQSLFSAVTFGMGNMSGSFAGGLLFDRVGGFGMFGVAGWIALATAVTAFVHGRKYPAAPD